MNKWGALNRTEYHYKSSKVYVAVIKFYYLRIVPLYRHRTLINS